MIRHKKHIRFEGDKALIRVEIDLDSADELPEKEPSDGELSGCILAQGSTAHVIDDGDFYELNSSGDWVKQGR